MTTETASRADELLAAARDAVFRRTDRMFACLMLGQWAAAIALAVFWTPYTWSGAQRGVHQHVLLAVFLGGAIGSLPIALAIYRPGRASTRQVIAAAQMFWAALLIHLSGGRVETHFHIFGSLTFLAFYRDWRVLPTATVVAAADHLVRGLLLPQSVYGVANPEWWRFAEHAFWMLFIDGFLVASCRQGLAEMRAIASRQAEVEALTRDLDRRVQDRTLQLAQAHAQLAQAQEIAHVGSWDADLHERRTTWSAELYRIFGAPVGAPVPADAVPGPVHPDDAPRIAAAVRVATMGAQKFSEECRVVRPDGVVRQVRMRGQPVVAPDGRVFGVNGVVEDVTEMKELQAKLVFADRMSSLGTLAAGVAHEVNNPLAYIRSNVAYAQEALAAPDPDLPEVLAALREVETGTERVRVVVRDLKSFSREDEVRHEPVDVARVVRSTLKMADHAIKHRARLHVELGATLPVLGNESRLGQVILNLLLNAAQALPEGAPDAEIFVRAGTDDGGRAFVTIRDTGSGIPADVRGRIFDPFFTTKPVGVGTGLGLSICHGLVTAMGGAIVVDSEVGRGSTFTVVLPPAPAGRLAADTAARPEPVADAGRRARVLLVDDEPFILSATKRVLSRDYDVSTTTSGREALERLLGGERFDAILCDLHMPETSGIDVYHEVSRSAPDQAARIVFLTGGAFSAAGRTFLEQVPNRCLEKPCDAVELKTVVGATASRPGTGAA